MTTKFRLDILTNVLVKKVGIIIIILVGIIFVSNHLIKFFEYNGIITLDTSTFLDKLCTEGSYFACSIVFVIFAIGNYMFSVIAGFMFFAFYANGANFKDRFPKELILNLIFLLLYPLTIGFTGMLITSNKCLQNSDMPMPFMMCEIVGFLPISVIYFFLHFAIFYYQHLYNKAICAESKKEEV